VGYKCHELLVSASGEVELLLNLPQPVLSLKWILREVKGRGPKLDEPLDLARKVLRWWVSMVAIPARVWW
jgi:hypothetical protein